MLLKVGSLLLIFFITGYCLFHFYRNKDKLSGRISKVASPLAGVSTAAFGLLLIQASNYHLVLTIILCVILAVGIGLLIWKWFPLENGLNELLSSLLGALFGSIFGYTIFFSTKSFLIVDVIFIVFAYLMLMFFDKRMVTVTVSKSNMKGSKKKGKEPKPSNLPAIALSFILLISIIIIAVNWKQIKIGEIGQPQNQSAFVEEDNNLQVATVHVTPSGFNPKNTTVTAATMMKIVFDVDKNMGNNLKLTSSDLKLNVNLKSGKNTILLDNPIKGKYHFTVEPGHFEGSFTVKGKSN